MSAEPSQDFTFATPVRTYGGDDVIISANLDEGDDYPADIYIRTSEHEVASLHLTPFAVRKLRDACTGLLVDLKSATIEAAGLDVTPSCTYTYAVNK